MDARTRLNITLYVHWLSCVQEALKRRRPNGDNLFLDEDRRWGHTDEDRRWGHTDEDRRWGHTDEDRRWGHTDEDRQWGHIDAHKTNPHRNVLTSDYTVTRYDSRHS
jgi:hypothetical protein